MILSNGHAVSYLVTVAHFSSSIQHGDIRGYASGSVLVYGMLNLSVTLVTT